MRKPGIQVVVHAAVLGLYWVAMNTALGAPPSHARGLAAHADLHPHLDLRPSANGVATADTPPRRLSPPRCTDNHWARSSSSSFRAWEPNVPQRRVPSRAEEFAQHVRREGLPLARLWENKSALVSLGLNKKGKPGLWIVQKIR